MWPPLSFLAQLWKGLRLFPSRHRGKQRKPETRALGVLRPRKCWEQSPPFPALNECVLECLIAGRSSPQLGISLISLSSSFPYLFSGVAVIEFDATAAELSEHFGCSRSSTRAV